MIKLISREYASITPVIAKELFKLNTFAAQRALSKKHVGELAKKMRDGVFLEGVIATAEGINGNTCQILVNGQHQLAAVIQSGETIMASVQRYG